MNFLNKIYYNILAIFMFLNLNADNRIIFYLQNPPEKILTDIEMELAKEKGFKKIEKLQDKIPSQVSKKLLKQEINKEIIPKISGFIALYGGYIDYSDNNGQISFPLRHIPPKLYLAITPKIKLVQVKDNTISHEEYYDNISFKPEIYLFEKKQDENKQFFWHVEKYKNPKNKINPLSIVLLTKPKNIYVAEGDYISNDSKHIILPNSIFVVGNIDNTKILLNTIAASRYFEPIKYIQKKTNDTLQIKIISNM